MRFNKINKNKNQGVAILYAVLLVSIVLTVSLSLLNISYKQIILTAVNRDSQLAHFNAWSAVDCILRKNRAYSEPFPSINEMDGNPFGYFTYAPFNLSVGTPVTDFTCGGGAINVMSETNPTSVGTAVISRYQMTGPGLNDACAIVDVAKISSGNYDNYPDESGDPDDTGRIMIAAHGYNSPHPCIGGTNSRLVERQIRKRD